jgi:WD40 repeat protein
MSASFSPDGKTLALGCRDALIRLVEPRSGELRDTLAGHRQRVNAVAFAPDGRTLASGGADGTVRLWHVATGLEMLILEENTRKYITGVAFSADGQALAVAGMPAADGTNVSLWFGGPDQIWARAK